MPTTIFSAMKDASSEHVVFYLATAYIEALQHGACARALPAHVTTLPLNGIADLKRRRDVLQALMAIYYQKPEASRGEFEEAHDIFDSALDRLRALATGDASDTPSAASERREAWPIQRAAYSSRGARRSVLLSSPLL